MKKEINAPKRLSPEVKTSLDLTDQQIAEFFNYKNRLSYATSSKKPWIENGLVCFLDRIKDKFVLLSKKEADVLSVALLAIQDEEGLSKEEKAILNKLNP